MTNEPLTISQATYLATLLTACQSNARVKWAVDGDTDRILDGVARAITHEGGGFLSRDEDVRDGYVWISGTFEHWLPVRDVLDLMAQYLFVVNPA